MKQSRTMSAVESCTQVAVGYFIALGVQVVIFPWFNIEVTLAAQAQIAVIFTVVSVVRSYTLRRIFEFIRVSV